MPPRPIRPDLSRVIALPAGKIPIRNPKWFVLLRPGLELTHGKPAPDLLRVPVKDAQLVLRGIIHLVADIAPTVPPTVVWVAGQDELLVLLDKTRIACAPGLVTISLLVQCDELRGEQRVDVAFAVGTPTQPKGLVMSTFDRVSANTLLADTWSGALTAFAWEALVTVAQQLAAGMGVDADKRPLVPGTIAADTNLLLIGAMARSRIAPAGAQ